jgi:Concanavalin A-like lectin/glucanases superfamily
VRTKLTATIMITLFLASLLSTIFSVSPANAAITGGKFGDALEFDGVDDYVMVSDSSSLRLPSTEVTVEAWICFPSNSSGLQLPIRKWLNTDGGWMSYVLGKDEDNKIYGAVGNKSLTQFPGWTTTQNITDLGIESTWAHIAFTWKKENINGTDGKIFVNGVGMNTTFAPNGYSAAFTIEYDAYPLYFARKADSFSFTSEYFKGKLDEVRISNVARTAFNLTAAPIVDANTVALWHFDEGTGLTAHDASANANNGTIFGAMWTGVIPEFPSVLILPLFMVTSLLAVILYKRKRPESFEG